MREDDGLIERSVLFIEGTLGLLELILQGLCLFVDLLSHLRL